MISCDKCGFGHRTFEEKAACKSWAEMQLEIRPCPGLLPPEKCVLDIGHLGGCVTKPPETGGFVTKNIKDGETVCEHGDRPFECAVCRKINSEKGKL
jgi:hypothetical protein